LGATEIFPVVAPVNAIRISPSLRINFDISSFIFSLGKKLSLSFKTIEPFCKFPILTTKTPSLQKSSDLNAYPLKILQ
jgi:hypothetical protein